MSSIELPFDEGVTMATVGIAVRGVGVRRGRPRRDGVRLTRRGRLVLLVLLLALAGTVGVLAASTGEAAAPAGPAPTVVVQPGDTLWSIAARYAPGPDPFATIEQIRRLNALDGYTVHAGETLVLPTRHR